MARDRPQTLERLASLGSYMGKLEIQVLKLIRRHFFRDKLVAATTMHLQSYISGKRVLMTATLGFLCSSFKTQERESDALTPAKDPFF
jgi:hypothetical protein